MSRATSKATSPSRLALLVASLLLGILTAATVMPLLFRAIPTDLSRIRVLLDALHDPQLAPEIVVFGSSRAMCGIDARQLSAELPGAPLALNLSSSGQQLDESWLFHQELPPSVRTIVQVISHGSLSRAALMSAQKWNAFYMYGYRAGAATRDALVESFGEPARHRLATSLLAQLFEARWAVRQFVDSGIRTLLRTDLALERATNDLYFPQPYTRRMPEPQLRQVVESLRAEPLEGPPVHPASDRLLRMLSERSIAAGRRFAIVLAPQHPAVRAVVPAEPLERVREYLTELAERRSLTFLDASELLSAEQFIDVAHPSREGAAILTSRVADALAATR